MRRWELTKLIRRMRSPSLAARLKAVACVSMGPGCCKGATRYGSSWQRLMVQPVMAKQFALSTYRRLVWHLTLATVVCICVGYFLSCVRDQLFFQAAYQGDMGQAQLMLNLGASVNARNDEGETALIIASRSCQEEMARFLLEHDADINIRTYAKDSALNLAQCDEMRELLRKMGAEDYPFFEREQYP